MTLEECAKANTKSPNLGGLTPEEIKNIEGSSLNTLDSNCTPEEWEFALKRIRAINEKKVREKQIIEDEAEKALTEKPILGDKPNPQDIKKPKIKIVENPQTISKAIKQMNVWNNEIQNSYSRFLNSIDNRKEREDALSSSGIIKTFKEFTKDSNIFLEIAGRFEEYKNSHIIPGFKEGEINEMLISDIQLEDLANTLVETAKNLPDGQDTYEFTINTVTKSYNSKTDAIVAIKEVMKILHSLQLSRKKLGVY